MNIEHGDGMETMLAEVTADHCVKAPNSKHQASAYASLRRDKPENIQAPNSKRRRAVPSPTSPSRWSAMPIPGRFERLRLAVGDAVAMQRGGHYGAWLQLEREWLELEHQKHRDARAAQQKCQKRRDPKLPLSDEDRRAIVDKADEILGLK